MAALLVSALSGSADGAISKVNKGHKQSRGEIRQLELLREAHRLSVAYRRLKVRVRHDDENKRLSITSTNRRRTLAIVGVQLAAARARWRDYSDMERERGWRKLCSDIESQPRHIAWKKWRRTLPSARKPLNSITASASSPLPSNLHISLNNFAHFYSQVMSPSPIPSWKNPVSACPYIHSCAPPSVLDVLVGNTMRLGVHALPSALDIGFTLDEIRRAVRCMKSSTAPGPDWIHTPFITKASPVVYNVLLIILNASWDFGIIPEDWKRSNAFAIYKKGDISDPTSYRMISITSVIMRIFERCWNNRVVNHLEETSFFTPHQAGFRRQLSTLDNIYKHIREIYDHLSRRKSLPILFLDIIKAFDRVPHKHLLHKLYVRAHIRGRPGGGSGRS